MLATAVAVPSAQAVTKREYVRAVTSVLLQLRTDFRAAGRLREPSPALRATKAALDGAAARLGHVHAPANAASDHRALISGIREYARQIDLVRASVDYGDIGTIASHLREVTAPRAINKTLDRLVAQGYRIPLRVSAP